MELNEFSQFNSIIQTPQSSFIRHVDLPDGFPPSFDQYLSESMNDNYFGHMSETLEKRGIHKVPKTVIDQKELVKRAFGFTNLPPPNTEEGFLERIRFEINCPRSPLQAQFNHLI